MLVVKVSGSLVSPPRAEYLAGLARVLWEASERMGLVVVVGGGRLARDLIGVVRGAGRGEGVGDLIGIEASRLNALLLALLLYPRAPPVVARDGLELMRLASQHRIVLAGGFQPGQSTNAVSLAAAELMGAGLVVNLLRGVRGVYERYPPGPGEEPLDCITLSRLRSIVAGMRQVAGGYVLLDHVALGIAERSGIRILFADGSDLGVVRRVLVEGRPLGTLVVPDGEPCPERLF